MCKVWDFERTMVHLMSKYFHRLYFRGSSHKRVVRMRKEILRWQSETNLGLSFKSEVVSTHVHYLYFETWYVMRKDIRPHFWKFFKWFGSQGRHFYHGLWVVYVPSDSRWEQVISCKSKSSRKSFLASPSQVASQRGQLQVKSQVPKFATRVRLESESLDSSLHLC